MALKSVIYKTNLQIADMDRHYYHDHNLTIARHPSETDERMMLRIMIFAMNAHEELMFTKGLSTGDEPDLWLKNLNGDIELWIELGQPDVKRIRKVCSLSKRVIIYCYSGSSADIWWRQNANKLQRFENLSVFNISPDNIKELGNLSQRNMQLHCNIQENTIWLGNGESTVEVHPVAYK